MISAFVDRITELSPQLVTFNGSPFDLPVLRYRAMVHSVAAQGLASRPYFNRYTEDAVDFCDVLSSFSSQGKATLNEMCRVMGLPGKPNGMSGSEVEQYFRDGRIREIADYPATSVNAPRCSPSRKTLVRQFGGMIVWCERGSSSKFSDPETMQPENSV